MNTRHGRYLCGLAEDEEPTDATDVTEIQLLREWFHWWHSTDGLPGALPASLHVRTAAYLAATAVQDGRKIFGPRDL